jgi:uncharacterized RDD family membrane protein YckC
VACPSCGSNMRDDARVCLGCGEIVRPKLQGERPLVAERVAGVPGWIALDGAVPKPVALGAGRLPRLLAYLVDSAVVGVGTVPLYLALSGTSPGSLFPESGFATIHWWAWAAIWAMQALYFVLFPASRFQATPGKMLFGMCIRSTDGDQVNIVQALVRFAVQALFIGVLMPLAATVALFGPIAVGIALVILVGGGSSPWDAVAGTKVVE